MSYWAVMYQYEEILWWRLCCELYDADYANYYRVTPVVAAIAKAEGRE